MIVPKVDMFVCPMNTPRDTSAVEARLDDDIDPRSVVALIGKTEGTGLHDDWGRTLADLCLHEVLAQRLGIDTDAVREQVVTILSGGCPGVISPHVTVVTQQLTEVQEPRSEKALVVGRARSERITPEEVGRMGQIEKVAQATGEALAGLPGASSEDVHVVMVKAPTLTQVGIEEAQERGRTVVTHDLSIGPHGAMCFSNDASALGVALALGEVPADALSDGAVRRDWHLYSEVAATSCAGDRKDADVLVLANASPSQSELRIGHGVLRELVDAEGIKAALRSAGLEFGCCPSAHDRQQIVQLFIKAIVPGSDVVLGNRVTLLGDRERHNLAKAIGGSIAASVVGRTTLFVSGGESNSHQGPPNGSPVAAVVERSRKPVRVE
jgi:cyanuric acid amidohydrolase